MHSERVGCLPVATFGTQRRRIQVPPSRPPRFPDGHGLDDRNCHHSVTKPGEAIGFLDGGNVSGMALILWLIAVALVIAGIVTAVRGQIVAGIALIILGLLVGPGGVSVFA